jgi:hypothetical protein
VTSQQKDNLRSLIRGGKIILQCEVLVHIMKAYRESRGIGLLILSLSNCMVDSGRVIQ